MTNARPRVSFRPSDKIRAEVGLAPHEKLIVAVGTQQLGHGLERIVESLKVLPGVHLATLGAIPDEFQKHLESLAASGRYHHLGTKPWEELPAYISGADIGVIPWIHSPRLPLNVQFAFPNRIFDYIAAGLPIVASGDISEIKNFILDNSIGEIFSDDIEAAFRKILDHPEVYTPGLESAVQDFTAEHETRKFLPLIPSQARCIAFVTVKDPSQNPRMKRMAAALVGRGSEPVFFTNKKVADPQLGATYIQCLPDETHPQPLKIPVES